MKDRLLVNFYVSSDIILTSKIIDFLNLDLHFKITHMKGIGVNRTKEVKFNNVSFFEGLQKINARESRFTISVLDELGNSITISKRSDQVTHLAIRLDSELFNNFREEILSILTKYFVDVDGIVGNAVSMMDNLLQNSTNLDTYTRANKSLEDIKIIPSPIMKDEMIIDIEQQPGHFHLVGNLWYGCCWKMWFGANYSHFANDILLSFQECYENRALDNGTVQITLYENVWDYDLPENRARQLAFRKHTGIDEVAHALMKTPKDENPDPSISIETEAACTHGEGRLVTYYYNAEGELSPKSQAVRYKSYEFRGDGQLVWSKEESIR